MAVSAAQVKELRERTGAGMMDCKKALDQCNGDTEGAIEWLRKQGLSAVAKRATRQAKEGAVIAYIHSNRKIGVLLELNCETDFVARTEGFLKLGNELAMQVAAMSPEFVSPDDISAERLERERAIFADLTRNEGKPEAAVPKIVEGRLKKLMSEICLLEQIYVRSEKKETVRDLITQVAAGIGENIQVRRFARFNVDEASGAAGADEE